MTVADASVPNEYDQLMLEGLAHFLAQRNAGLDRDRSQLIATIVFKAANELLWMAFSRESQERSAVIAETKVLITAYLKTFGI